MAAKPPASVVSKLAPPPVPAATPDSKSPAAATPVSKKKKEEPPPLLKAAQTIAAASGNHYVVDKMLGKGGFGEVSALKNPDKKFAMKVEPNDHPKKKMLRLKIEIHVFDMLKTVSAGFNSTHFVRMHDKGITKTFKYYVMDLIWLSLKDVCDDIVADPVPDLNAGCSPSTLITIARQTLKAIEALHDLGFLHRDIKAANYAVGRPPNEHIIYMLDFGVARPYKDAYGKVKVARERVPFMGTPRYASIRSMENMEQCRKDDLEVWSYMMLELHDVDYIFWYKEPNRQKILESKKYLYSLVDDNPNSRFNRPGFLAKHPKFPTEYFDIMTQISRMLYESPGPFTQIEGILDAKVARNKIDMHVPLEWVGKKPKSPEKPKKEEKKEEKKDAKEEKKEKKDEKKSEMKKVEKEEKKPKEEAKKVENKKEVMEVKHDTKKGRKKESKKKKEIEEIDDEEVITMEIMLEELKREKRRRDKMREAEEYQDEGNSDDDSEEDRRSPVSPSPRRARKKKSKMRPRDNSDRDQRDDDRRDDSRRRRSGRRRKRSRPSKRPEVNEEDSEKNVAKTPEKDSMIIAQPIDDGEYMKLGDVNEMEAQDAKNKKDKMGVDPKKQPPSSDKK